MSSSLPLMPKATAVWLVENTALSFEQISEFCGLHALEVQAIADGEVAVGMVGLDPIQAGQITKAELERCQADPTARLKLAQTDNPRPSARVKGPRYTPVTKRAEKPDGIAWLLKTHTELSDGQICKLIGTTKPTISAIRDRTHWNMANIKPQNPVLLGLCKHADLEEALISARMRLGIAPPEPEAEEIVSADPEPPPAPPPEPEAPLDPLERARAEFRDLTFGEDP